jgi:hypothetical protein
VSDDLTEPTSEDVAALTAVVRDADRTFEKVGGSSRHWVRDCFCPFLQQAGWSLVKVATLAAERQAREQAEQERDRLREVLDKFGVHQSGCAIHAGIGCSCGLDAALSPQDGQ